MYRGPFFTMGNPERTQSGRKGRGWRNDLLFVSPSFLKRAKFYNGARAGVSMKPVLGGAACWLAVAFREVVKLSLLFRKPMAW